MVGLRRRRLSRRGATGSSAAAPRRSAGLDEVGEAHGDYPVDTELAPVSPLRGLESNGNGDGEGNETESISIDRSMESYLRSIERLFFVSSKKPNKRTPM